jgi:Mn2+/Fe2+ NRAMP family transporter
MPAAPPQAPLITAHSMKKQAAPTLGADGQQSQRWSPRGLLRTLGPGLITGAADDDPSGIATYSQTGARFGYSLGWLMIISYPMMAFVQGISAGIGAVTGAGIAENLRRHYPSWMLRSAVLLLIPSEHSTGLR